MNGECRNNCDVVIILSYIASYLFNGILSHSVIV